MLHGDKALASLAGLLLVLAPLVSWANDETPAYRLGIFPFMAPAQIEERFGALSTAMGKVLQRPVELRTRSSFASYSAALAERQFDIALVQPLDYVEIADRGDYLPVARLDEPLSAIIAVPASSPIMQLSQLREAVVALPPVTAAVSLLSGPILSGAGLMPGRDVNLSHTRGHDSCLQATLQARAAACVTTRIAMDMYSRTQGERFRILAESDELPHILFVISTDFPVSERARLEALLLDARNNAAGRAWLASSDMTSGLVPARDADYDVVRRLRDAGGRR